MRVACVKELSAVECITLLNLSPHPSVCLSVIMSVILFVFRIHIKSSNLSPLVVVLVSSIANNDREMN